MKVCSEFGVDRFKVCSGFGLDRFKVSLEFGLDRFKVSSVWTGFSFNSGFSLDMFYCTLKISNFDLLRGMN